MPKIGAANNNIVILFPTKNPSAVSSWQSAVFFADG
jgi:hypothetical protein